MGEKYYRTDLVSKRISETLNRAQGRLGLTQNQMAQRLDMPIATYKKWANSKGTDRPNLETIAKIIVNLNITYDDIFEGIYKSKYRDD